MKAKDVKWCPQHGYPLPCYKCGMPLSQVSQKEIFKAGKKAGQEDVIKRIAAGEEILIDSQNVRYYQLGGEEWQKTAQTQAEISFKMGYNQALEDYKVDITTSGVVK